MASPSMGARLEQFWIFQELSNDELAQVAKLIEEKSFRARDVLFRQGEQPDYFYLIERGAVLETGRDPQGRVVLRRRAEKGDFVGRHALLRDTVRRAKAVAEQDTKVLAFSAPNFKTLIAAFPRLLDRLRRIQVANRLLATPLFNIFTQDQLFHLADLARIVEYPAGGIIYQQSEPSNAFYVIDRGQVEENVSGMRPGGQVWPKYLTAGNFFGRRDLIDHAPRRATARAVTDVHLFRFNAPAFHWLCELEPAFVQALDRHDILGYLRQMPIFSGLNNRERKHLAGFMGLAHLPEGEILYRQGEIDSTLYYLYEGGAVIRIRDEKGRARPSGYLEPGDTIGEHSLLLQDPRDATVQAAIGSNFLYLTREDLDQFLEQNRDARRKLQPQEEVRQRQRLKRFPWMDADEQFVLRKRRFWFFLAGQILPPAVLILLALGLFATELPAIVTIFVLILPSLWMLWRIVDWANDYYVVTTKRVAHREKVLGVRETRDETPLDKIQNINIERGFWGNRLNFGTLVIDTAAAAGVKRVTFNYLGEPEQVQAQVFEQVVRLKAGERSETRQVIRDQLEQTMGMSIRPIVPRPAVPPDSTVTRAPSAPGILRQVINTTFGRWFWMQRREGDRIVWRKHWIRLLTRIWMPALFLLFLGSASALLMSWSAKPSAVVPIMAVFILPAIVWLWWSWENWGNDLYVVTNDRIIDIEALPLGFRSKSTETTFDRIQNISFDIPNPIATLLNYGTVVIYTAGAEGRLDFEYVRDPKGIQAEIFRRVTAYEAEQRRQQRQQNWEELPQWFATNEGMQRPL